MTDENPKDTSPGRYAVGVRENEETHEQLVTIEGGKKGDEENWLHLAFTLPHLVVLLADLNEAGYRAWGLRWVMAVEAMREK